METYDRCRRVRLAGHPGGDRRALKEVSVVGNLDSRGDDHTSWLVVRHDDWCG